MFHSLLVFRTYSWMFIRAIVAIWMAVAAPLKSYPLTTGALKFWAILFILPTWAIRQTVAYPIFINQCSVPAALELIWIYQHRCFQCSWPPLLWPQLWSFYEAQIWFRILLFLFFQIFVIKRISYIFSSPNGNFPVCLITY